MACTSKSQPGPEHYDPLQPRTTPCRYPLSYVTVPPPPYPHLLFPRTRARRALVQGAGGVWHRSMSGLRVSWPGEGGPGRCKILMRHLLSVGVCKDAGSEAASNAGCNGHTAGEGGSNCSGETAPGVPRETAVADKTAQPAAGAAAGLVAQDQPSKGLRLVPTCRIQCWTEDAVIKWFQSLGLVHRSACKDDPRGPLSALQHPQQP